MTELKDVTVATLRPRVQEIGKAIKEIGHCEMTDALEFKLWFCVLRAIASGAEYPNQLAREALRTREWED